MVLIGHGLLKSRHELVMLRWGLRCQYGWLDNCLQFSYDLCPWVGICSDDSILHFLGYLLLLGLSLHLLPNALDLSLQSNILGISLGIWIHHGHHFGRRRRWWVIGRSLGGVG